MRRPDEAAQRRDEVDLSSSIPIDHSFWIRWGAAIGIVALVVVLAFTDLNELWRELATVDLRLLWIPFLASAASYAAMARSYQGIAWAAGYRLSFREMFKITLVANVVNYVLASGGLSGFAVRMYFLARRGVPSGSAVIISLVQTFITNVALLLFVLAGFVYLFSAHTLHGVALVIASLLLAVLLAAAVVAAFLLFHARTRRRTLFVIAQSAHWLMHRVLPHRTPPRTHIWRYQRNLNRGIEFLLSRKSQMAAPVVYIFLDWALTLGILWAAFRAVGHPIQAGFLIVGFAVGMLSSIVSLIPGGLGVLEGTMSAVYVTLGVPLETAVAAVLVYRLSYYILPVLVSSFLFHGMFVQGRELGKHLADAELRP